VGHKNISRVDCHHHTWMLIKHSTTKWKKVPEISSNDSNLTNVTKHMPPFVFVQGVGQSNFSLWEELLNL
jgi:hypothetical protein